MTKGLLYAGGFWGAVIVALILYVFVRDGLEIPRRSIVVGALASACVLSLVCAVRELVKTRK